jgi:hypothetical protein
MTKKQSIFIDFKKLSQQLKSLIKTMYMKLHDDWQFYLVHENPAPWAGSESFGSALKMLFKSRQFLC